MFSHARRLSWSGEKLEHQINLKGLTDPSIDLGVPGGRELVGLVDAFVTDGDQEGAREAVIDMLGFEAFVDSAAVFGNFEMMNRIAEGSGIPIPPQLVEREDQMMKTLGLYDILKSQQL